MTRWGHLADQVGTPSDQVGTPSNQVEAPSRIKQWIYKSSVLP